MAMETVIETAGLRIRCYRDDDLADLIVLRSRPGIKNRLDKRFFNIGNPLCLKIDAETEALLDAQVEPLPWPAAVRVIIALSAASWALIVRINLYQPRKR